VKHLVRIVDRIAEAEKAEKILRKLFCQALNNLPLPRGAQALSISTGDGVWDYTVFKSQKKIKSILATDVVENPVDPADIRLLQKEGRWKFIKVAPENSLPLKNEKYDIVYHNDVIEHVKKVHLFLSEQYRVLKRGGVLLFTTPNLLRVANVVKILTGSLGFPTTLGHNEELGDFTHIQEFTEWSLRPYLEEIGFTSINLKYGYFGIKGLGIDVSSSPINRWGKIMCQYLVVSAIKPVT
jgi:ubiquinone/menaquinone biosynthesis C-methylase UbiE